MFTVVLDYPARGFTVWGYSDRPDHSDFDPREQTGLIRQEMRVIRVDYYVPASQEKALEESFFYGPDGVRAIVESSQPGQGFRRVQLSERLRW